MAFVDQTSAAAVLVMLTLALQSARDLRTGWDVLLLPLAERGGDRPIPVLHSEFTEMFGMLSPDGRWMVYTSDESGGVEVYVAAVPNGEWKRRISTAGGNFPRWRADGKELFYVSGTKLMSAEVRIAKDSIDIGVSHALFDMSCRTNRQGYCYDVSRDGKRFLLIEPSGPPSLIAVIQNWTARLKK